MDNSTYHREFVVHIKTIETYGGSGTIGITPTFVAQKLQEMHLAGLCSNVTAPSKTELAATHKSVHDEFLAALMLSGANRDHYGPLRNELANQYGFGNDLYPKSIDQCVMIMNRCVDSTPICQPRRNQHPRKPKQEQEDEPLVFAQDSDKKSLPKLQPSSTKSTSSTSSGSRSGKITTVVCRNCGQRGHVSAICP